MLTEIVARTPRPRPVGPTTPLDDLILRFLADGEPRELCQITKAVEGTTHKVHARAQSLVGKGLVTWTRNPGGPARGPGASVYQLAGS